MLSDGVEKGMECEAAGRVRGGVTLVVEYLLTLLNNTTIE